MLPALKEKKDGLIAVEEARLLKEMKVLEGGATTHTQEEKELANKAGDGVTLTPQEGALDGKSGGFRKLTETVFKIKERK